MLSGRENYSRTIEYRTPEFIPVDLGAPFEFLYEKDEVKSARIREIQAEFANDALRIGQTPKNQVEPHEENGVRRWTDAWGTGWVDDGFGAKTEIAPLAEGYHLMPDYPFPDPHSPEVYRAADEALQHRDDRYVIATVWFTLFERMWMLRGFDNLLLDPYTNEQQFQELLERVLAYDIASVEEWNKRGVDGIFFSDDWGSQRGLLMNPDDWRRWYKPAYARLFQKVHEGGAHVWMHLCGNVSEIIPDLIEIGLNVLHPVQPQAMDIHTLARDFGGKVCFYGGADVQGVLVNGSPDEVRAHVDSLVATLCRPDGGYILSTSHGIMPETPLDNIIALFEAALEHQKRGLPR